MSILHEKFCRRVIAAGWNANADYATLRVCWRVIDLGLSAPAEFWRSPPERIIEAYNGIGPDRWPRWCRRAVTALLARYEPAAMVHDYEYEAPRKTFWRFTVANARLGWNSCVIALRDNELMIVMARQAVVGLLLAFLCQLGGWHGFKTAHERKNYAYHYDERRWPVRRRGGGVRRDDGDRKRV